MKKIEKENYFKYNAIKNGLTRKEIKEIMTKSKPQEECPMGVSQWREHGKKYGYWDYFEDLAKKDEGLRIIKEIDNALNWATCLEDMENRWYKIKTNQLSNPR